MVIPVSCSSPETEVSSSVSSQGSSSSPRDSSPFPAPIRASHAPCCPCHGRCSPHRTFPVVSSSCILKRLFSQTWPHVIHPISVCVALSLRGLIQCLSFSSLPTAQFFVSRPQLQLGFKLPTGISFCELCQQLKFNSGKACSLSYCSPYLQSPSYPEVPPFPRHTGVKSQSVVNFSFPSHNSPVITLR